MRAIEGTLLTPKGEPLANAQVLFTALANEQTTIVKGSNSVMVCNVDGFYSERIEEGIFSVLLIEGRQKTFLGEILVTPGPVTTLGDLFVLKEANGANVESMAKAIKTLQVELEELKIQVKGV